MMITRRNNNNFFCRYYHNITSNTLVVLEAMAAHNVKTLIYSSTCATYGEPKKMPITEETPQVRFPNTISFHLKSYKYKKYENEWFLVNLSLKLLMLDSNQPIWKSQENVRRYHNWLLQNNRHGCYDPEVGGSMDFFLVLSLFLLFLVFRILLVAVISDILTWSDQTRKED